MWNFRPFCGLLFQKLPTTRDYDDPDTTNFVAFLITNSFRSNIYGIKDFVHDSTKANFCLKINQKLNNKKLAYKEQ